MRKDGAGWLESFKRFRIPRWEELPDFELYSDQVISFMEKYLGVLFNGDENFITSSMIHNYVKLQLMPKPEKKRYNRRHVASLITITVLKQVLVISDIRDGIDFYKQKLGSSDAAYDLFCGELEYAISFMISEVMSKQVKKNELDDGMAAVRMAAFAFASKILARYILENNNDNSGGSYGEHSC